MYIFVVHIAAVSAKFHYCC